MILWFDGNCIISSELLGLGSERTWRKKKIVSTRSSRGAGLRGAAVSHPCPRMELTSIIAHETYYPVR